jgi:hypothetical protein
MDKIKKKILLTGANGFIGTALSKQLLLNNWNLIIVGRKTESEFKRSFSLPCTYYQWLNPTSSPPPKEALENIEAVINLMGEPLAGKRWTNELKKQFLDSRVQSTRLLIEALKINQPKLKTFISASAIGIYGNQKNTNLNEQSDLGKDFLSSLCQDWETEALKAPGRSIQIRLGLVLSTRGGALSQIAPLFEAGLGGKLSDGTQWMSWIHIDDAVNIFMETLNNSFYSGPVNAVAPQPVINEEFTVELARALKVKAILPAPRLAIQFALGEIADMILASQKVLPNILLKNDFKFLFPDLQSALKSIYDWKASPHDRLFEAEQWVAKPINEVFSFFSNENNLETLTPSFLQFKVDGKSTANIIQGTEINYSLRIHGIPTKWKSRITIWNPNLEFKDVQIKGPYSKWEHTHLFEELSSGTLLKDKVIYQLPFAAFGGNLAQKFVADDIRKIFDFRKISIEKIFN